MIMLREPKLFNYPEGTILYDVRYSSRPECFEVVYFDPLTERLEVNYEEAVVDIWFLKKDKRTNQFQIAQARKEDCYVVYCKPSQIPKVIAEQIGGEWENFYECRKDDMPFFDLKSKMCECPWVFKADFEPSVYYRLRWLNKYGLDVDVTKVQPGFLDIETDVLDRVIEPRDYTSAPQPVNAVTLIFPHVKIAAVLVLGPRPRHLIHEKFYDLLEKQTEQYKYLCDHIDQLKHELKSDPEDPDKDNEKYVNDFDIRIHTFDFKDEIVLLKTVFDYINKYRPWFIEAWNAPFDFNYLFNRIRYLGYQPEEFVIPKEFKTRVLRFNEDKNPKSTMKTSRDWFNVSSYSNYICQMRTFAAIRKAQSEQRSYALTYIGQKFCKIGKSTKFDKTLAYNDLWRFIKYNFRDVVVQYAIEKQMNDCGTLVSRAYMFATNYGKLFQETHIVRNTRAYYFEQQGYVMSCRLLFDKNIDGAFRGAFVAEPKKNKPTGLRLNGKYVNNIIYGGFDADAASYYPSTKMGCNMDPMSMHFKCSINNNLFVQNDCINRSMNQQYIWKDSNGDPHDEDMTGPIFNAFKNKNIFSMLYNWFGVPSIGEVFEYLDTLERN